MLAGAAVDFDAVEPYEQFLADFVSRMVVGKRHVLFGRPKGRGA